MKEIMLDYLYTKRSEKGIPTLSKQEWKELNSRFAKEDIIAALIKYIETYSPEPPILPITKQDMEESFRKLQKANISKFYLPPSSEVVEKFDDYGKPFKKYGLGMIQMGNSYLDLSNYFNQTLRMNCDTYGFRSAHYRWKNKEDLRTVLLALWRLGNDKLDEQSLVGAFRMSTYIATQFKPQVAKFVYDYTNSKVIFDSSCGWGDRLAGFYTSEAKEYYGCDPNPETFEMYKTQCLEYERILGGDIILAEGKDSFTCVGKKKVVIHRKPAEDMDYDSLPEFDCSFTSPPYFSTELYGKGKPGEEDQSWNRYNTYEKWRDNFYLPVNREIFRKLKSGGVQIVNIQDPKVHGVRYYASDDLITDLTTKYKSCIFLGNLGMRMSRRPKNISKEGLKEHFKGIYIEPMWCFGKNRNILPGNNRLNQFME